MSNRMLRVSDINSNWNEKGIAAAGETKYDWRGRRSENMLDSEMRKRDSNIKIKPVG